jgi:DNA-binding MarR family transcriptional regulator
VDRDPVVTAAGSVEARVAVRVALTPFDWRVLRLAADQGREGAGTGGLAAVLGVSEERVVRSARRLERCGFLVLHANSKVVDTNPGGAL